MKNDSAPCTWPNADAVCITTPSVIAPEKKPGAVLSRQLGLQPTADAQALTALVAVSDPAALAEQLA